MRDLEWLGAGRRAPAPPGLGWLGLVPATGAVLLAAVGLRLRLRLGVKPEAKAEDETDEAEAGARVTGLGWRLRPRWGLRLRVGRGTCSP